METTSRYGIMSELNERKIAKKEELAKLEADTDMQIFARDKQTNQAKKELADKEKNYVFEHEVWLRDTEMKLKLMKSDHSRAEKKLEKQISEKTANYEKEFQTYKAEVIRALTKTEEEVSRFKKERDAQIKNLKEVVDEINSSIEDLKEMSKEQK